MDKRLPPSYVPSPGAPPRALSLHRVPSDSSDSSPHQPGSVSSSSSTGSPGWPAMAPYGGRFVGGFGAAGGVAPGGGIRGSAGGGIRGASPGGYQHQAPPAQYYGGMLGGYQQPRVPPAHSSAAGGYQQPRVPPAHEWDPTTEWEHSKRIRNSQAAKVILDAQYIEKNLDQWLAEEIAEAEDIAEAELQRTSSSAWNVNGMDPSSGKTRIPDSMARGGQQQRASSWDMEVDDDAAASSHDPSWGSAAAGGFYSTSPEIYDPRGGPPSCEECVKKHILSCLHDGRRFRFSPKKSVRKTKKSVRKTKKSVRKTKKSVRR